MVVAAAALAGGIAMSAPVANAASAGVPAQSRFTAQALAAGLTSTQAGTLQAEVDRYRVQYHGTQVAANKIQFAGGDLAVTLPGETRVRTLDPRTNKLVAPSNAPGGNTCDLKYFCAWATVDADGVGTGNVMRLYNCTMVEVPDSFTGTGLWINNQTPGVRAGFYGSSKSLQKKTAGAYSYNTAENWNPVWYIKPCGSL